MILVISFLMIPGIVSAKSIQDYRSEIAGLKKEKKEAEEKTAEVQAKIDAAKAEMEEISRKIVAAIKEQDATKEEIKELEKEIELKEEEIKDLVVFYQISDNDNFYLKFIFGADSFEDFIYRFSVAEQLTDANDKLVDEMNNLVEENEKKIAELEKQQKELDALDKQMAKQVEKLGDEKDEYSEFALSFDDKIAMIEKKIKVYKDAGCSETEDISSCMSNGKNIPSATGFIRPVNSGIIENDGMSEYGWRWHPVYGGHRFHEGMDISGMSTGSTVMAAATGTVAYAGVWGSGGAGGNTVILYHNVNGAQYTTMYLHLDYISVSIGQIVAQGEKVGGAGTTGSSTGVHLHFQVSTGHNDWGSNTINPRNIVNFPAAGVWW